MSRITTAQRRIGRAFSRLLRERVSDPVLFIDPAWLKLPGASAVVAALRNGAIDSLRLRRVAAGDVVLARADGTQSTWAAATVVATKRRRVSLRWVGTPSDVPASTRASTFVRAVRELRQKPEWWA